MKRVAEGVLSTVEERSATTLAERVQRLKDVRSIEEAIAHYARCVDDCDADGVAAIFPRRADCAARVFRRCAVGQKLLDCMGSCSRLFRCRPMWCRICRYV